MKQNRILFALAIAACTFVSCSKKDYTCTCDGGLAGQGMQPEIKKSTKSNAEKACKSYDMPNVIDGFNNCRLQ